MTVFLGHPAPDSTSAPERLDTLFERVVYVTLAFPVCFACFFILILFGRLLVLRSKVVRVMLFAMVFFEWHGGRWPGPFLGFVLTYEVLRWVLKRWIKRHLAPETVAVLGESAGVLH